METVDVLIFLIEVHVINNLLGCIVLLLKILLPEFCFAVHTKLLC